MADRDVAVCTAAEDVLRVAEARTRKPLGSRHLARGEHTLVRLARVDLEELPDRGPELLQLVDRPLPQVGVVLEREPPRLVEPVPVARDRGGGDPLPARLPDDRRRVVHAADATSLLLACDRARELAFRHLRTALGAEPPGALVQLVFRVLLDVDAAEGLALAAPLLCRRFPGARVAGAGAVLRHPAAAALLVRVLERGHRRAVRALTFAVLLDRGVVGLGKRPLSFRPRALQGVRELRAPDLSPLRQLRHGPPPLYVMACWLTPDLNMPPVAIFVRSLSACDSSSRVWSIRSLMPS